MGTVLNNLNSREFFYLVKDCFDAKDYKKVLELCKERFKLYEDEEFWKQSIIKYCYAPSIYYLYVKNFNPKNDNERIFIASVNRIVEVLRGFDSPYYILAIFKLVDYLIHKNNPDYEVIDQYLNLIDVNKLLDDAFEYIREGKIYKYPSKKEKWYVFKIKTLLGLKKYDECVKTAEMALKDIKEFHLDNDIWIKYFMTRAKLYLGDFDGAEEILNDIIKFKDAWYFYSLYYYIYKNRDNEEEAIKYASAAALSNGEHKHKINLYEDFSRYLKQKGFIDYAFYHILLVKKIREEENWSIKDKLINEISSYQKEDIDKRVLLGQLNKFWKDNRFKNDVQYKGKILKILDNKKAGFILCEDGNRYYFRLSNLKGLKLQDDLIDKEVTFYLKKSFDRAKMRDVYEAIEVVYKK